MDRRRLVFTTRSTEIKSRWSTAGGDVFVMPCSDCQIGEPRFVVNICPCGVVPFVALTRAHCCPPLTSKKFIPMLTTPRVIQITSQITAVIPLKIPNEQMRNVIGPGIRELMSVVAAQSAGPAGPWFSHHLRFDPDVFDFEISVPVSKPVEPTGRVHPSSLPGGIIVQATYTGPYEGLSEAWCELRDWIESKGYNLALNFWEAYVRGPESTSVASEYQTVLSQPLAGGTDQLSARG